MDGSVYPNKDFVKSSKTWVSIYCNKETEHGTKKVGDTEMCALIPGITCEEHVKAHQELASKFFQGTILNPHHIWCDVEGKEIGREKGSMAAKLLIEKMAEASKKVGPGLGADEFVYAKGEIAEGDKLASEKKYQEAIKSYAAVVKMQKAPGAKAVADEAQNGLNRLNEIGRIDYDKASEIVSAKDWARAKELLKGVMSGFKGLPIAKDAEKKYAEVCELEKSDKGVKGK
jgi:hypothetical protein